MTKQTNNGCPRLVASAKWLRVFLGGELVADSKSTLLLRAHGQLPVYYFPPEDVQMSMLKPVAGDDVAEQGEGPWPEPPEPKQLFTVRAGEVVAERAAWQVLSNDEHPDSFDEMTPEWTLHGEDGSTESIDESETDV